MQIDAIIDVKDIIYMHFFYGCNLFIYVRVFFFFWRHMEYSTLLSVLLYNLKIN